MPSLCRPGAISSGPFSRVAESTAIETEICRDASSSVAYAVASWSKSSQVKSSQVILEQIEAGPSERQSDAIHGNQATDRHLMQKEAAAARPLVVHLILEEHRRLS